MVDGNFTAQHMKMRRPENDVPLSDGLAYMVADEPYQKHISQAANNEEVCIIKYLKYNFHIYALFTFSRSQHAKTIGAVNDANTNKTHLRATGVGATACARHGCFVPHSVVDFYKGEQ